MQFPETQAQSLREVGQALDAALIALATDLRLRAESDGDQPILCALYTEFRWPELAIAPWPDEAKRQFLAEQFALQSDHYRKNYLGAAYWVVTLVDEVIGRVYLYRSPSEFRLMDIMLFERFRGRGYGRVLIDSLLAECRRLRLPVTLHVERDNPARLFYERRGFTLDEDRDVYLFMRWSPD